MDNDRRIYLLNGYPPEVIAVAFAKCSRSPEPFDVIASDLNETKSQKFHEKWVIGYGHSSVAEHAVLNIALENVSIIASKVIEDNRLASFTEKSTRYQQFDKSRYFKPGNVMASPFGALYEETLDFIFDTYTGLIDRMTPFMMNKYPKGDSESDAGYTIRIKNKVFDNLRYMLPAASLTNLGMTINARQLEYAIVKLLSHPLQEMQAIGHEIKEAARKVTPTLLKYTNPNVYYQTTSAVLSKKTAELLGGMKHDACQSGVSLVEYDKEAEDKLAAAILFHYSHISYSEIKEKVSSLSSEEKAELISDALKQLDKFDRPIRELENIYYTFDVVVDYGAFRDIQRHRMCTQIHQKLTVDHGFVTEAEIIESGCENEYKMCMEKAIEAYNRIYKDFPDEASYIVPFAFKTRLLMTFNLRSLFHFIKLRSSEHGHISYRSAAIEMFNELEKVHPVFSKFIQCHTQDLR